MRFYGSTNTSMQLGSPSLMILGFESELLLGCIVGRYDITPLWGCHRGCRQCSQWGSLSVLKGDGGGQREAIPSGFSQNLPCNVVRRNSPRRLPPSPSGNFPESLGRFFIGKIRSRILILQLSDNIKSLEIQLASPRMASKERK